MSALKMLESFSHIFTCTSFNERHCCLHRFRNHVLVYVYSGTLNMTDGDTTVSLHPGECVFIRNGQSLQLSAAPAQTEEFHASFLALPRNFLCEFYHTLDMPTGRGKDTGITSMYCLPDCPEINSLFHSFVPYYEASRKIPHELYRLKMAEAVYALLGIDCRFSDALFDFTGENRLSILDVLNGPVAVAMQWKTAGTATIRSENMN